MGTHFKCTNIPNCTNRYYNIWFYSTNTLIKNNGGFSYILLPLGYSFCNDPNSHYLFFEHFLF